MANNAGTKGTKKFGVKMATLCGNGGGKFWEGYIFIFNF